MKFSLEIFLDQRPLQVAALAYGGGQLMTNLSRRLLTDSDCGETPCGRNANRVTIGAKGLSKTLISLSVLYNYKEKDIEQIFCILND